MQTAAQRGYPQVAVGIFFQAPHVVVGRLCFGGRFSVGGAGPMLGLVAFNAIDAAHECGGIQVPVGSLCETNHRMVLGDSGHGKGFCLTFVHIPSDNAFAVGSQPQVLRIGLRHAGDVL